METTTSSGPGPDDPPADSLAPGWRPHPEYATVERYWDGTGWTGEHRFAPATATDDPDATAARTATGDGWTVRQLFAPSSRRTPMSIALARVLKLAGAVTVTGLLAATSFAAYRALTVPPPASGDVTATCSVAGYSMRAHAYYRSDGRRWRIYKYLYRLTGGGEPAPGGLFESYDRGQYNNLNISVTSDETLVYSDASPDDRTSGRFFRHHPVESGDSGEIKRSDPTYVTFEGIFDVAYSYDPRCTARTPLLPVDD